MGRHTNPHIKQNTREHEFSIELLLYVPPPPSHGVKKQLNLTT